MVGAHHGRLRSLVLTITRSKRVRRGTRALIIFVLAVAALAADSSGPARAALAAPGAVRAAPASPTSLTVTWTAPTPDPSRWWVMITSSDDRSVGQRTACGACRSMTVAHLAPGSQYFARVVAIGADGSFGSFSAPVKVSTPSLSTCVTAARGATCGVRSKSTV